MGKTCLYGLKTSGNIEIELVFQFKFFFHLTSNLHTSCFSAFKYLLLSRWHFLILIEAFKLKVKLLKFQIFFKVLQRLLEFLLLHFHDLGYIVQMLFHILLSFNVFRIPWTVVNLIVLITSVSAIFYKCFMSIWV